MIAMTGSKSSNPLAVLATLGDAEGSTDTQHKVSKLMMQPLSSCDLMT
jgi:hypothetical protein